MPKAINASERIIDIGVARRVRLRRSALGITQTAMARQIGVTYQQFQKCEKGANRISSGRLWRIAEILRVTISYFFEDLQAAEPPGAVETTPMEAAVASPTGSRILRALGSIEDPELKRRLADLVEGLASSPRTKRQG